MRLEKREHPEAREELRQAAYWYEDREPGLGDDFYYATDTSFTVLAYAHQRRGPGYWQHRLVR